MIFEEYADIGLCPQLIDEVMRQQRRRTRRVDAIWRVMGNLRLHGAALDHFADGRVDANRRTAHGCPTLVTLRLYLRQKLLARLHFFQELPESLRVAFAWIALE